MQNNRIYFEFNVRGIEDDLISRSTLMRSRNEIGQIKAHLSTKK